MLKEEIIDILKRLGRTNPIFIQLHRMLSLYTIERIRLRDETAIVRRRDWLRAQLDNTKAALRMAVPANQEHINELRQYIAKLEGELSGINWTIGGESSPDEDDQFDFNQLTIDFPL
jgi:hypothetical protein